MTELEKAGFIDPDFERWYFKRYGRITTMTAGEILAMRSAWSGCCRMWKKMLHKKKVVRNSK